VAVLVAAFIVLANFSATESAFRCEGEITAQSQKKSATFFMTLTDYRWWVKLWSNSDGMLLIEAPKEGLPYQPYLGTQKVGNGARHIYENSDEAGGVKGQRGAYYKRSNYLTLDTPRGLFEGDCVPIKD
jgi:hypothetical protein